MEFREAPATALEPDGVTDDVPERATAAPGAAPESVTGDIPGSVPGAVPEGGVPPRSGAVPETGVAAEDSMARERDSAPLGGSVFPEGSSDLPEGVTGAVPGSVAADMDDGPLLDSTATLRESWLRIQAEFVDDPRASVAEAAGIITDLTETLISAIQRREQRLRASWQEGDSSDTELLRTAFRRYRAFFDQLTEV